jgi:hypothetical protein
MVLVSQQAAQHRVQRTRAGFRLALTDSAPLAFSTFGFFLPSPALAANASRWLASRKMLF